MGSNLEQNPPIFCVPIAVPQVKFGGNTDG